MRDLGSIVTGELEVVPTSPLPVSKGNVSPALLKMLNEQISHESYNAHLYLKIQTFFKNMGLDNIATHFAGQFAEENEHQKKISDYMTDRNEDVMLLATPQIDFIPTDLIQVAKAYLAQEQLTTAKLSKIAMAAWSEADLLTFKFMQDMLEIQRAEEDEAFTFLDQAEMTQNDPKAVLLWNMAYEG